MTGGNDPSSRGSSCQVRVGVRVRPLASKEIRQGGKSSLSINQQASIQIASQKAFTYDAVFDSQTDQSSLYASVSSSLLESFVDGYNATVRYYIRGSVVHHCKIPNLIISHFACSRYQILAYGQTGSGKT